MCEMLQGWAIRWHLKEFLPLGSMVHEILIKAICPFFHYVNTAADSVPLHKGGERGWTDVVLVTYGATL